MFGYITTNYKALTKEDQEQYRQYYCGLCRCLEHRFGNISRFTLNNDMTFLLILLSSLYEAKEETNMGRCLTHPLKKRSYISSDICAYCADMTILLSYFKCMDDKADDGSLRGKAGLAVLRKHYLKVKDRYPQKVRRMEEAIDALSQLEADGCKEIDPPMNLSGKILGEVFAYREDYWENDLRALGEGMGRFIYLMDAYDDLKADMKKGNYNPLLAYRLQEDFESFCEESLLMMIAECTTVFETMPLENHLSILRNVLYSGVWMRYWQKTGKVKSTQETNKETEHE